MESMLTGNLRRAVHFLRVKKGWRQADLGARAAVSRETVSRLERGELGGLTLDSIERVASALGATIHIQLRWRGEQLDRLMDAAHAAVQDAVASLLIGLGWLVHVETSFNHYGDRGRIDIIAFHPLLGVVLVIEIKSVLGDLQETVGRLDVKARVARKVAADLGWEGVVAVVPALVVGDSRTARRIVARHAALFARYQLRGRSALAWVRHPVEPAPSGLLWFANGTDSHQMTTGHRRSPLKRRDSRPE
jgi:transcriptional regulator with XRE-family HTH domain